MLITSRPDEDLLEPLCKDPLGYSWDFSSYLKLCLQLYSYFVPQAGLILDTPVARGVTSPPTNKYQVP